RRSIRRGRPDALSHCDRGRFRQRRARRHLPGRFTAQATDESPMTTPFPGSPKTLRGGLVLVDPSSGAVKRVITLQYNSDSLSRTLQVQGVGDSGERSEALRFKGPAVETIKLEAELDAADQLEFPKDNPNTVQFGLHPQLAALESLINPTAS